MRQGLKKAKRSKLTVIKACWGGCSAKGPENCTECKEGYAWQFVGGEGGMNISSDGVLQVQTEKITVPHYFEGAKRACVSLTKPKTILEKKAAATGTQKIFDPNVDVKMAQEIIKQQYKEKEVIIKISSKINSYSGAKTTSRSWQN